MNLRASQFGLTKYKRLRSGKELREISRLGKRSVDSYFAVVIRVNDLSHARLGITVSRRVSNSAVIRNRIKRCVRESFRKAQEYLVGMDFVVIAKPTTAQADPSDLRVSLHRHWMNTQQ